jgi:Flp pilus assembly protein TadD
MKPQQDILLMHLEALDLLEAGKHKQGLELILRVLQLRPNDPQVLITVGNALSDVGRCQEAIQILRHVVERLPGQAIPLTSLGAALLRNGEAAAAEGPLERALAMEPADYATLTNLAGALILLAKNPERAEQLLRRADRLSPDSKTSQQVWLNLGWALKQQGKLTEADQAWTQAIRLSPQTDQARAILARHPHLNPYRQN